MNAKYIRLYSDANGESHFEDVEVSLHPVDFAPPAPPPLLSDSKPSVRTAFLGGPAGWTGEWHTSSGRNFFVVISGEWELEASDGAKRTLRANDVVLVEDTVGKGHNSRVLGGEDSLALLVELAE